MSSTAKVVLGIVGTLVALCFLGVIVGAFWFKQHAPELISAGREGATQGAQFGGGQSIDVCEPEALRRVDACGASMTCTVGVQSFFRGCLEASNSTPAFCAGVPGPTEIMASAHFGIDRCAARGRANDTRCTSLMNQVTQHCHPIGH